MIQLWFTIKSMVSSRVGSSYFVFFYSGRLSFVSVLLQRSGGSRKFWWGGGDFKHITSKSRMSSPKLRVIFRPKSEIRTFFSPKIRWSPKKKKVFTDIEVSFSAGILRLRLVGGMHPEMQPNCSK